MERASSGWLGAVNALLLPCLADARDWDAWAVSIEEASRLLKDSNFVDADIAGSLQLAGEMATRAHHLEQARAAFGLSLTQWRALDNDVQVEQVLGLMSDL